MIAKTNKNAHISMKSYTKRKHKVKMHKQHHNKESHSKDEYYCFCEYINKNNDDVICYCTNKKTDWNKMNENLKKLEALGII